MVHIATIVPISLTVGANRIVPGIAIPYPLGDPSKSKEEEMVIRRHLVVKAFEALQTEVTDQTVFKDED